jgi:hypothetical protein
MELQKDKEKLIKPPINNLKKDKLKKLRIKMNQSIDGATLNNSIGTKNVG